MKNIEGLMKNYKESLKKIEFKNFKKQEELKLKIKIGKNYLHQIRVYVRTKVFESKIDEITFFKSLKPKICGELKFFKNQLDYELEKPFVSVKSQKSFIQSILKNIENKKKRNHLFYAYIKRGGTRHDDKYFMRTHEQLELFSISEFVDCDPEFSTSHDFLASEVVFYKLIISFFKHELYSLDNIEEPISSNHSLQWSASKSDLIEIIYAFHSLGVLENGNLDIKEIALFFEKVFNISLGDFYRSFQDIRSRKINQTKFIDKLKESLNERLTILDE